MLRDLVSAE